MRRKSIIFLAIIVILLVGLGYFIFQKQLSAPPDSRDTGEETQQRLNINIESFAFSPSTLTVSVGETVTWKNLDSFSHTIASDFGNELNSENLRNGETYSHTFNAAGTFDYHCTTHPSMKGKIIVE